MERNPIRQVPTIREVGRLDVPVHDPAGVRLRDAGERIGTVDDGAQLAEIVTAVHARGGKLVIPAFAIGRMLWKGGDGAIIDGTIDGTANTVVKVTDQLPASRSIAPDVRPSASDAGSWAVLVPVGPTALTSTVCPATLCPSSSKVRCTLKVTVVPTLTFTQGGA